MFNKGLRSSNTPEWTTPAAIFRELDYEFHFDLDPCATDENHKCARYFTKDDDGLLREWTGRVFCNPPYGRRIGEWVKKARVSAETTADLVVCLLPARTDTAWFHDDILGVAEIRFLRGRQHFGDGKGSAPFPSMVVIFRRNSNA